MSLFHFHVTQVKRSAGQSAIASAAYRAGEKLYSEYYGEVSDYTRKGGVVCAEIFLPPRAPPEYKDRATLWNAVENAERGKKAQLAYSFDVALQNELTLEENIDLARRFVSEYLVGRGMIADLAIHVPEKENPNPHFHILCPIRPLDETGGWGQKQRRVYRLSEDGNRIIGEDSKPLFDAVPTTDWGTPETLEYWREQWAAMVNAKFAEKGLNCRIDHRSYARQEVVTSSISFVSPQAGKLTHSAVPPFPAEPATLGFGWGPIPAVHEGPAVRQMEARGVVTDKGEWNRWIRKTNAVIAGLKRKITAPLEWLSEAKTELSKPTAPNLADLLGAYYNTRNAGAWSQKAKVGNLKRYADTINFLTENGLFTVEDLERRAAELSRKTSELRDAMKARSSRMKDLRERIDLAKSYQDAKAIFDEMNAIKWKGKREKFKQEHDSDLRRFYAVRRKLDKHLSPAGTLPIETWTAEFRQLQAEYDREYAKYQPIQAELKKLQPIRQAIDAALRQQRQDKEKARNAEQRA